MEYLQDCIPLYSLKISYYRKLKLINKDLLESRIIVLLIKDQHCFLVFNRIYCSERDRTIMSVHQN